MRLATFLDPGADDPAPARSAATRSSPSPPAPCSTGSPRGDRTPADGEAFALADVTLLAPVPRPRAIFGIGLNYAAHARETGKELPEAPIVFMKLPELERAADRPRALPGGRAAARLRGRAGCRHGPRRRDRRLRGRRRRLRARPAGPRAAVDARQGRPTLLPLGAVDHDRRRGARPRGPAPHHARQRRAAPGLPHVRPRLRPARAGRLHRRGDHARARRPDPHRHAQRRRAWRWTRRSSSRPGDVVRCEVEGLGAIEHPVV